MDEVLPAPADLPNDVGPRSNIGTPIAVKRSLITLKALTYAPTGGIVAAATTSLPERLGGVRNWDYRYCWLRDATFTVLALMHLGYYDEARAWRDWLVRAVAGSPQQVQIMYGVGGERWLPELTVPWLPGYENSSPVRIGTEHTSNCSSTALEPRFSSVSFQPVTSLVSIAWVADQS